ncbi:hypothetical protein [Streptomyces sp. NPDC048142]|uniref:hypothetical protein n=1 Tax=Streptomyces sp. NPDC048142 TaxID=3365501 RepID=UPI00371CCC98
MAEELYHSVCDEKGQWSECDHLNGGIAGIDIESPEGIAQALAGSFMEIVSESTALIFTGCADNEEAEEEEMESLQPLRILNVLVADEVDFLELEYLTRNSPPTSGRRIREVKSPLNLIVLLPGEHVLVSPTEGDCALTSQLGPAWEIAN